MEHRKVIDNAGLMVLLPTRGNPTIETLVSMGQSCGLPTLVVPGGRGMGVVDQRNYLAECAIKIPPKASFVPKHGWIVLWVDDDAFWTTSALTKVIKELWKPGVDICAGWFCGRAPHQEPKVYTFDDSKIRPGTKDCPEGAVVEVARVGFHFVAHRIEVLEALGPNPFTLDGTDEKGEDLAFCERAKKAGFRIWVHTGAPVAHIDDQGLAYLPGEGPMRVVGGQLQKIESRRNYNGGEDEAA